jgi:hypothetical protein
VRSIMLGHNAFKDTHARKKEARDFLPFEGDSSNSKSCLMLFRIATLKYRARQDKHGHFRMELFFRFAVNFLMILVDCLSFPL